MADINAQKNRIEWVDILRGFMMLFVIYGHISVSPVCIDYIYSFHMPIYFMISGMTYSFNKEWRAAQFTYKKLTSLVIPYFFLNLYAAPLREWLECIGECNSQTWYHLILGVLISNADSGYKMASNTNWFIPCLFLCSMMVFAVHKVLDRALRRRSELLQTVVILGITLICALLGLGKGSGGVWHYRGAVFAMLFYQLGYLFMKHIGSAQKLVKRLGARTLLLSVFLICAGFMLSHANGYVSIIRNIYKTLPLFYAAATVSCLGYILSFMWICEHAAAVRKLAFVDLVGRKTLPYIALQVPLMKLVWYYMPKTFGTKLEPYCSILTIALYLAMIPLAVLVDRFIPKGIPCVERMLFPERAAAS